MFFISLRQLSSSTGSAALRPIIGLEIHAQILSRSKLFSRAGTSFLAPPNSQVAHFDCAFPGTLPVLNRKCVEAAVLTGLAFNCQIAQRTTFDRKHYFYSDLPSGYQITQYFNPIAFNGAISYQHITSKHSCEDKTIKIKQIQLEQDSGKSMHDSNDTLVDLNRCGMGLLEIVTEPDFTSADEVTSFLREIHHILSLLGVCSGRLEEGALRVDANVSIQRIGDDFKGVRTEVKNLNSIRSVLKAIQFEILRQSELLKGGKSVISETRSFDSQKGCTVSMRDKERVFDYRYMPEPNLPPLHLYTDANWPGHPAINVDSIRKMLPQRMPNNIRQEFTDRLGLRKDLAARIVGDLNLLALFENSLKHRSDINATNLANFILVEVVGFANSNNVPVSTLPADKIADIVWLRSSDRLTSYSMRAILKEIFLDKNPSSVESIVKRHGIEQVNDYSQIESACKNIFAKIAGAVKTQQQKKNGRPLPLLMGQLMKESNGKFNPKTADAIFKKLLEHSDKS